MSDTLDLLHKRNSAPRLTEPGPDPATLQAMLTAAVRAPDHAWLQPWRFIVIEGDKRDALGELFVSALLAEQPDADSAAQEKAMAAPLRAPMLITVVCRYTEHPKVPRDEQLISAGCAAHAMLLAAEAQGYAGIWRTGSNAESDVVASGLGLADNENIVGFLYFGTRAGAAKPLPDRSLSQYVSVWPEK